MKIAKRKNALATILIAVGLMTLAPIAMAREIQVTVTGQDQQPLPLTMVTLTSDGETTSTAFPEYTGFTDKNGQLVLTVPPGGQVSARARKPGYQDGETTLQDGADTLSMSVQRETDVEELAEVAPANAWVAAMNIGDADFKEHFRMQCSFCHQQGSAMLRMDRTEEEWEKIIDRMLRYGSRLMSDAQGKLPKMIRAEHTRLRDNPQLIPPTRPWGEELIGARISEWKLGSSSSQLHDVFLASTGLIYVGDNLQDDLIELDPKTGRTVTHKIPHGWWDSLGGNIGGRLKNYPGVGTYVGLHSLAESPVDGHLFLTGSDSSRLVEFAPETGKFTLFDLPQGFYPHTVRIDAKDRVWFTMAVSNQVAMFDRERVRFTFYDMPNRSFKESVVVNVLPMVMTLARWGMNTHKFAVDHQATGLPMPYGIDIAPDGSVWFARLHAGDIGKINPDTHEITMYKTPFKAPRRLKTDADGNVWVTVFGAGKVARFDPKTEQFELIDLPTRPLGSDTPYALSVDRERRHVWITGTASDTIMRYDIASKNWSVFPLPRRVSFTRDVVVAKDGSVFTSNGSFPTWHIEDGQPTVIRIVPNDADLSLPLTKSE